MLNESKIAYHNRREREERNAAQATTCAAARERHEQMADLHNKVATGASLKERGLTGAGE